MNENIPENSLSEAVDRAKEALSWLADSILDAADNLYKALSPAARLWLQIKAEATPHERHMMLYHRKRRIRNKYYNRVIRRLQRKEARK